MRDRTLWLAAIVLVSFLAIWPFVSREALPAATDAELHIYRLAELARLVSAGELYPRIAPNLYYGYGYPIFNYYAPFSYYLGLLPMAVGFSAVQAVKLVFIFGLLLGAFGMAGFVRRYWGPHAGLIAAAAYIYAPFVHFVEAHARGDLPESLSLGLLPLAFWAMAVLSEKRTTRHWLVAVGIVAVIVLTHNLMALVFAALLAAWLCWAWLVKSDSRGDVYWRGAALLAGILLASFFWLPVFLERDAVNLGSLIGQDDHFDFRNHFLSLRTLFSAPTLIDWGATEPEFAFNLGLPQIALGLMGTVSLAYRWRRENRQLFLRWLFYLVGLLLILLLMLPISTPVWSLVPLLPFLQFPWRLLGVAAFCLAVLGAVGAHEALAQISKRWGNSAATWSGGIALGVILATAMPLAQPPPWNPDFGPTSAGRVLDIELSGRWLGTTSTADFVPVTVEVMPKPQPSVMAGLSSGGPVDRINWATVPEDVTIESHYLSPLSTRYMIVAGRPFAFRLFLFAFPGWTVTVDGEEADWQIGDPEGFIWLPVSEGRHVVEVTFRDTPARSLSWVISGMTLLLAIGIGVYLRKREVKTQAELVGQPSYTDFTTLLRLISPVVLVLALFLTIIEPGGTLRHVSQGLRAIPAENAVHYDFDGKFALIGYDAPEQVEAGDTMIVTLYWKATTSLDENYQVFVHLLGPDGGPVAQSDKLNPGDFPTELWPLDRYVRDAHRIEVPAGLAAGEYQLTAGLWQLQTGKRLLIDGGQQEFATLREYHAGN